MAEFLSAGWVAALAEAGAHATAPPGAALTLQQVVVDDDGREEAWVVRVADGRVAVTPGRAEDADVTFTQDRATAAAIATGELSAQAAFLAGRLRVGGDLAAVLGAARDLAAVEDVFGPAREGAARA